LRNSKKKLERMFDRPEFRHVLPNFWSVASEYEIVPDESREDHLKKIVVKNGHPKDTYVPFQETDLFVSFIRLVARGKPSDESVLDWVGAYGLLRKAQDGVQKGVEEDKDRALAIRGLNQAPELVGDFIAEALQARSALNLYTDLSSGSIDDLRRRIGGIPDKNEGGEPLSDLDFYFLEKWGHEVDKVGRPDSSDLGLTSSAWLEGIVLSRIENVRPALYSDFGLNSTFGSYRPTPSWECPDLISAIYLQLYLWITEGLPMRRCIIPTCGTPFPITRSNKKVCSVSCRSNLRHYPELQHRR
jgi:hypothetical protein